MVRKLDPALKYILQGIFVPYSGANLKLSFKPTLFFNDLEKISRKKRKSLRNAYYSAIKDGYVKLDKQNHPCLTKQGSLKLEFYNPKKLPNSILMVIFDIPEEERRKRRHLRVILRELKFNKIQQSVWGSKYDSRRYLASELKKLKLEKYVAIYESDRLDIEDIG